MPAERRDPLLRGTRLLLVITTIIFTLAGIGALGAILPAWAFSDHVVAWLSAHADGPVIQRDALLAVTAALVGLAVMDVLSIQFLRKLIAIIDSVGQGSPFIPENAARLRVMAWLVMAMQGMEVLSLPLTPWLRHALSNSHFFVPFSLAGLVLALLLFILARVFEHGTRLTEDVEGTV
jgi:hypothetical protein